MANTFINARTILGYIDTTTPVSTAGTSVTPENFKLVACLQNQGVDGTTSAIAATSKCSGKWAESIGGEQGWTMTMDGLAIDLELADTRINHNELLKMWKSGTPFWVMVANADDIEASLTIRYGVARIDSMTEAFPDNDAQTFSISLTGIGELFDQDDLAPIVT